MREFRSVPIGRQEFIIVASIPKFYCHDCKVIRQAQIYFARPKKHYTKRLERYVLSLDMEYFKLKILAISRI